jgi:4-hydroxy-3-methylbut-2-enyl diphosphate reductase
MSGTVASGVDEGMRILLASPRGFCAGVDRAIDIVERAIELFGAPIYVRHEVVHNRHVVERLRDMGARFVEELAEVPDGATVIFSAHGVSSTVEEEARRRGFQVFDATCPLVTKVHLEVARYARDARDVVLIGHAGHPEVEGTMGRFDAGLGGTIHLVENVEDAARLQVRRPETLAFVTQTTLSVDDTQAIVDVLRKRFPQLQAPRIEDICYATQNRQDAVKRLLELCDVLVVVGSVSSSNSNRLRELADRADIPGYLVDRGSPRGRGYRWRFCAGAVGAAGGGAAQVLGRHPAARDRRSRGKRGVQPAARPASRAEQLIRPSSPPQAPCARYHCQRMIDVDQRCRWTTAGMNDHRPGAHLAWLGRRPHRPGRRHRAASTARNCHSR